MTSEIERNNYCSIDVDHFVDALNWNSAPVESKNDQL